jgi:hypothetical protein
MPDEWIIRDPATGLVMVGRGHNLVHDDVQGLLALAALLIRAAYEVGKGEHDAAPMPASEWEPGFLKIIADA